jgi:hypothetical protein
MPRSAFIGSYPSRIAKQKTTTPRLGTRATSYRRATEAREPTLRAGQSVCAGARPIWRRRMCHLTQHTPVTGAHHVQVTDSDTHTSAHHAVTSSSTSASLLAFCVASHSSSAPWGRARRMHPKAD